ncbi:hypothetical protein GOC85_13620 [Haloferax alexandrinus]|uniref:Uncharacterized protein n=1 Tax=Haloferax volcanii TaxID=2246 RepID=A0A847TSJ6_HALVO|nr:hypothetical protein [Haloferax alexandrinus]
MNPLFETVWYTYTSCGRTPSTRSLHYHPKLTTKHRCRVLTEERTQFIYEVITDSIIEIQVAGQLL